MATVFIVYAAYTKRNDFIGLLPAPSGPEFDAPVTIHHMADATIRELRANHREVFNGLAAGERLTVTRSGRPVAELPPLTSNALSAPRLLLRSRRLPTVGGPLQADLHGLVDADL